MTDRTDIIYVENDTAVNIFVFNGSEYQNKDLLVKLERIENPDTLLRNANLSHVTLLRVLLRKYSFENCCGTL